MIGVVVIALIGLEYYMAFRWIFTSFAWSWMIFNDHWIPGCRLRELNNLDEGTLNTVYKTLENLEVLLNIFRFSVKLVTLFL